MDGALEISAENGKRAKFELRCARLVAKLCRMALFELDEAERQGKIDKNQQHRLRALSTPPEIAFSLAQTFLPFSARFVTGFDTGTE
jgi:hypothetical protein